MSIDLKILDCTLRDGGYVNSFSFGEENIRKIVDGLTSSGVDIIEIGFLKDGNHGANQTLFNRVSEAEKFTTDNQEYCLMIRPDWYDIEQLESCTGNIANLRFAFHYTDMELALDHAKFARELGYNIFFNPVSILNYSKAELKDMLTRLNEFSPAGVSIVDTFGSLVPSDLHDMFSTFNEFLDDHIGLGLHLHENLSLSMSLATHFIELMKNSIRTAYLDSSVLGMGRVPGNLCTELLLPYVNRVVQDKYDLSEIYKLIDDPISTIRETVSWGYMPAYAITGFLNIHRSYAEHLMDKRDISLESINIILDKVARSGNGENFTESLVDEIYEECMNEKNCQSI